MKLRLLHNLFYCFLVLCFTSCVSKKKYVELKTENAKLSDKNTKNNAELNQTIVRNDSLKTKILSKDLIIDSLNLKISEIQAKKEKPKVYSSKKSNNIPKDQENETKAQFIYNFAAYIEWPVIYNGTEFVIGVAGDKDVVKKMQETIGNKKVGGKKMRIEKYNKVTNYHLVYVASSHSNNFATIKNESKKNKTILVSDDDALFSQGAHISFIINDDKIKYTINKPVIEKIGLRVSQELMRFSE